MAKYIKFEDACEEIHKSDLLTDNNKVWAVEAIGQAPAADLSPKSEVAREIFAEIYALCNNAEEKLDVLFTKVDDYRKGYENSVKHFKGCIDKLHEKYVKE